MMRSPFYANSRFANNYYINRDLYLRIKKWSRLIKLNAYYYMVANINYEKIYNISFSDTIYNNNLKIKNMYKEICRLYNKINNNEKYTKINLEKCVETFDNMEYIYIDLINI